MMMAGGKGLFCPRRKGETLSFVKGDYKDTRLERRRWWGGDGFTGSCNQSAERGFRIGSTFRQTNLCHWDLLDLQVMHCSG